jgi:N-acetylglucosamine-6-phosphate deacetylase
VSIVLRGGLPSAGLSDAIIEVTDDVITTVTTAADWEQARGKPAPEVAGTIWPGLIDLHCHGGGGHTLCTTDEQEALAAAAHHARHGTTSVMGSLVTAPAQTLLAQVRALAPLVADGHLLGVHLEGPFLSPVRCGAQDPAYLIDPDPALTEQLLKAGDGAIKVVTVAPELPGVDEVIAVLREAGVTVALGHTDASYEMMRQAIDRLEGAALITHLANGMPPLHHRSAGPAGAALVASARDEATVELIDDGVHVDQGFAALTFAVAAPGRVALITDAMAAAGMSDGEYDLGPQRVRVADGVARLAGGGDSLAGGTSHLAEDVSRADRAITGTGTPGTGTPGTGTPGGDHGGGVGEVALAAASSTPARIAGLGGTRGVIAPGARADLLVHAPGGDVTVLRAGRWVAA